MSDLRILLATAACAALLIAGPLAAQQPTPRPSAPQDTTKPRTPRDRVIDKLRALSTAEAPPDTTKKDSLATPVERGGALNVSTRQTAASPAQPSMEFPTDSMMQELLKLKDLTATQYRGASAVFRADSNNLVLYGAKEEKAGVLQQGRQMTADSLLTFDQTSSIACGYGKPVLSGGEAASPVESQQVCYDTRNGIGVAKGARTQVSEGANWFVSGDLYYKGGNIYGHDGSFTDCSLPYPHYHFAAGEVKVVNNNVMVARNVTLNFADVPVFWLPFMMQSMKQGRRTGILMPQFSVNDIVRRNSSYNRRISNVGFYWAISDFLGSRLALDWWANNYTAVDFSFDYNLTDKFMNGGATLKRFWQSGGGKQFSIAANHGWQPDERTNITVNAQYATSTSFVRQTSFDPRELSRQISSTAGLSRRFNWGSVSMQADRRQDISSGRIDYTLPSLGVNFSNVTLFPSKGEAHWYSNGLWTSSAQVRRTGTALSTTPNDPSSMTGNFSSSFSFGKLSWSQSFESNLDRREARRQSATDSLFLLTNQSLRMRSSLSWTQRLVGTTTFTPSVNMSQEFARRDTLAGNKLFSSPMRLDVSAGLKADLFAFLPGIGPLARIRHRISPSISYGYAPAVNVDTTDIRSRSGLFSGLNGGRERNSLTLQISQTLEGKYKEDAKRDTARADSAAIDSTSTDPTKPRRLPQPRKVQILSLTTDALAFDFAARPGEHTLQTTSISNSINSDILRGLQLTMTHDLFKCVGTGPCSGGIFNGGTGTSERKLAPHLSRVSTSFSLSNNSWLFKFLGLGRSTDAAPPTGSRETPTPQDAIGGVQPTGAMRPEYGVIGTRATETAPPPRGAMGSWNASFNLTIERPRNDPGTTNKLPTNEMTTINFNFQPTPMWNVSWQTGYSFTTKDFTDHVLQLTRQMHDWDANFNFVKAQNGNFSFLFNVRLRANPDIKFDYNQRTNLANRRRQ